MNGTEELNIIHISLNEWTEELNIIHISLNEWN